MSRAKGVFWTMVIVILFLLFVMAAGGSTFAITEKNIGPILLLLLFLVFLLFDMP